MDAVIQDQCISLFQSFQGVPVLPGFHGNSGNEGTLSVRIAVEYSDQDVLAGYAIFSL
jgi:hypothetical protein